MNIKEFYDDAFTIHSEAFKVPGNFYRWVLDLLIKREGKYKVLDIGCGGGWLLKLAEERGLIIYGIDISTRSVKMSRKVASNSEVCVSDGEDLPWRDDTFDYVICLGTLEHFPHPEKGLKEISRVLKKSGRVCIVVPNSFSLVTIWKVYREGDIPCGQPIELLATRKEWQKLITNANLRVISINGYNYLPWKLRLKLSNMIYRFIAPLIPFNMAHSFAFICTK